MMKLSVYIETTIVSYLTARPSRDLVTSGHQAITRDWWDTRRLQFDLYCSQLVVDEAGRGDLEVAGNRLAVIADLPILDLTDRCLSLAETIIQSGALPLNAVEDATHIALATIHGMDYLLTWNCRHIANAEVRRAIGRLCRSIDVELPIICTPEELLGE